MRSACCTQRAIQICSSGAAPPGGGPPPLAAEGPGLTMATFREMAGFPAEQREREADLIKRLLANEVQGGQRDWVLLNAAMLLYAAGKGPSIIGSLATARRTLESGQAHAKLAELAAVAGSGAGAAQRVGIPA